MNILPKKNWHVRTWKNIVRVKKDERKAAAEEQAIKDRASLAEKEFRTKVLRDKATERLKEQGIEPQKLEQSASTSESKEPQGHVNFFADIEAQLSHGANKDHEDEKKKLREEEERKVGLLKYLGEGSTEYMKDMPWWSRAPERPKAEPKLAPSAIKIEDSGRLTNPSAPTVPAPPPKSRKRKHVKEKRKKSKKSKKKSHKKKKKRSRSSSSSGSSGESDSGVMQVSASSSSCPSIEKLREERLRREREERAKTEKLMRKIRGEDVEEPKVKDNKPAIKQRYNSQFNPELAKQNAPVEEDKRQKRY